MRSYGLACVHVDCRRFAARGNAYALLVIEPTRPRHYPGEMLVPAAMPSPIAALREPKSPSRGCTHGTGELARGKRMART